MNRQCARCCKTQQGPGVRWMPFATVGARAAIPKAAPDSDPPAASDDARRPCCVGQAASDFMSASYCAHGYQSLPDMFVRSELRREDVLDDPFFIDDVGNASWKEPHRFPNRKCLAE